ncbi:hypothetical protein HanLR1_Chr07g0259631 [Helianthus annuus]|nr:hypothetical protein HanLR1_Chr07g0259631 [Helianthus annuus]
MAFELNDNLYSHFILCCFCIRTLFCVSFVFTLYFVLLLYSHLKFEFVFVERSLIIQSSETERKRSAGFF